MPTQTEAVLSETFSPEDLNIVISALNEHRNIAIFGDTRTGKTFCLRGLLKQVDPKYTIRIRETKNDLLASQPDFSNRNILTVKEHYFNSDIWKKLDGDLMLTVMEDAFTHPSDREVIERSKCLGYRMILTVNSFLKTPSTDNVSDLAKVMLHSISDFVTIQCTHTAEDGFKATVITR